MTHVVPSYLLIPAKILAGPNSILFLLILEQHGFTGQQGCSQDQVSVRYARRTHRMVNCSVNREKKRTINPLKFLGVLMAIDTKTKFLKESTYQLRIQHRPSHKKLEIVLRPTFMFRARERARKHTFLFRSPRIYLLGFFLVFFLAQ